MTGSSIFLVDFTNRRNLAKPNYHMSIKIITLDYAEMFLQSYRELEGLRISYRPYLVKFQPGGLVFIVSFFVILNLFLVLQEVALGLLF